MGHGFQFANCKRLPEGMWQTDELHDELWWILGSLEPWFKSQMWSYVELPACWKLQTTLVGDDVLMILNNSTLAWAIAAINMEIW